MEDVTNIPSDSKKYLYAFDLSMAQTGLVIFDPEIKYRIVNGVEVEVREPVIITHITTNPKQTYGERLYAIYSAILKYKKECPPYAIAIERGFERFNTSTQVTYRVHGLINFMFWKYHQYYYPPKKVKATILNGNATKKQLQEKIKTIYPEIEFKCDDESDAFSVGITHFVLNEGMKWNKNKLKKPKKFKSNEG